jgi:hypothetical protein
MLPMNQLKPQSLIVHRSRIFIALAALTGGVLPALAPLAPLSPPESASMLLFAGGVFGLAASLRRSPFEKG